MSEYTNQPIIETLVRELMKGQEQFKVDTLKQLSSVSQKVDDLCADLKGPNGRVPRLEVKIDDLVKSVERQRGNVILVAAFVSAIILGLYKIFG